MIYQATDRLHFVKYMGRTPCETADHLLSAPRSFRPAHREGRQSSDNDRMQASEQRRLHKPGWKSFPSSRRSQSASFLRRPDTDT